MPIPFIIGTGVGLADQTKIDANFAAIAAGTSSVWVNSLTAHAGGTQAAALALTGGIRFRITTVGSAGDSVALPLAAGQTLIVINAAAANSMNVFAQNGSSDTINGVVGSTAFAVAAGKAAEFLSAGAGVWNVLLSA